MFVQDTPPKLAYYAAMTNAAFAITENDRQVSLRAVAGQTDFDFDFPLRRTRDLSVSRGRDGAFVPLSPGSDYEVTVFGESWGGTIALKGQSLDGDLIDLSGERAIERSSAFTQSGKITAKGLNNEFDDVYILLQELRNDTDISLKIPTAQNTAQAVTGQVAMLGLDDNNNVIRLSPEEFRGATGTVGATGQTGATGVQGQAGPQGPVGSQGEKGDRGETSALPSAFTDGSNGVAIAVIDGGWDDGEPRENMTRGDIYSLDAAPGVIGYDADKKIKLFGKDEFAGSQGLVGTDGKDGEKGETGARGDQGIKGDQGMTGDRGLQGETGQAGAGGKDGEKGDTGARGDQGVKGDQGMTGDRGLQGETGQAGAAGKPGTLTEIHAKNVKFTASDGISSGNVQDAVEEVRNTAGTSGDDVTEQSILFLTGGKA